MAILRTVRGDVDSDGLGHIQPHEHVLSHIGGTTRQQGTALASEEPIRLDNYYEVRRHHSAFDMRVDDIEDAVQELERYREAGGSVIVDATSIGLGRNPRGLVEVAERTGLHVIMGSGWYHRDYHPEDLRHRSRDQLATQIRDEVTTGVGDTGVRAGLIGEIGLSWPVDPVEDRVLRAAVDAHLDTGAALMIHPGRAPEAPADAMARVREETSSTDRVVMSHIDRTLFSLDDMLTLADTGCYLEFDLFGQESSYYPYADIDMPNDAMRLHHIRALCDRGHRDRILLSQDICFRSHLQRYGGEGYAHLLRNVVPLMLRRGFDKDDVTALTVDNPRRMLEVTP
ncbi:phosphotriesterase family protein [Prauserella endophytica]|uniref:Aryldialkylphosphatase n=1 Tax=Prauserella endophytica TaxID=1592324 RepID=A0ABY2S239_9PSEU|nr:aryldialkylphosphatase [Prauserella endophytica]TKG69275.1 aryldialkylphosphatase [Prauserella endophytica]